MLMWDHIIFKTIGTYETENFLPTAIFVFYIQKQSRLISVGKEIILECNYNNLTVSYTLWGVKEKCNE